MAHTLSPCLTTLLGSTHVDTYIKGVPNGLKYMEEAKSKFQDTQVCALNCLQQPWDVAFRYLELMSFKEEYLSRQQQASATSSKKRSSKSTSRRSRRRHAVGVAAAAAAASTVSHWRSELMANKKGAIHDAILQAFPVVDHTL